MKRSTETATPNHFVGPKAGPQSERDATQSSEGEGAEVRYKAMFESALEYRKVLEDELRWARYYVRCLDRTLEDADVAECLDANSSMSMNSSYKPS
jgi:hypothetical protein